MDTSQLYLLAREHFDPHQYNTLFQQEIAYLLPKLTDPQHRQHVQRLRSFDFVGYIMASLRNAGFKGQQEVEDKAHEIAVRLVVTPGKLFAGYDEQSHGPLIARFKGAVEKRHQEHRGEGTPPPRYDVANELSDAFSLVARA